ncbi:SEC-C metal-binding domain-containing protein [Nocardia sp. NPDC088792]|uniref:SEC-C metal-binding domain-containing protein n=1 Tax=Nocardia sp. NPDC088792 TaxID=3364332 RepID=UPI0038209C4A
MSRDTGDDAQYRRLRRRREQLEAENARLRAELSTLADVFGDGAPPEEIARHYEQEAAEGNLSERAQNLSEAASYWALAGDVERARRRYLDAIADGGRVAGDARVWYASFLLEHGREAEARAQLDVVFAEGLDDYQVYEIAGEAFETREDWEEALNWFEAGLKRSRVPVTGNDSRHMLGRFRLSSGRARVRKELGLPEDENDSGVDEDRRKWIELLEQPDRPQPVAVATLYFPETEFAQAIQRWPALQDSYGTFDEHRYTVEHTLRTAEPGLSMSVTPATVDGLIEYAAGTNTDPENPSTRAAFAAQLLRTAHATPWPPGRNETCWCGSGRKYKKCCGRPA